MIKSLDGIMQNHLCNADKKTMTFILQLRDITLSWSYCLKIMFRFPLNEDIYVCKITAVKE